MALYINLSKNSLKFNEDDFEMDVNYLPEIVLAFSELNPEKTITFIVDLPETPVVFVLYVKRILEETEDINIKMYHRDDSQELQTSLGAYGIPYFNIEETKGY